MRELEANHNFRLSIIVCWSLGNRCGACIIEDIAILLLTYVMPNRFFLLVARALRLACPFCGEGGLFRTYFRMYDRCPHCEANLEREPGFFLGSIYFNYGLTSLIVAVVYPVLLFTRTVRNETLLQIGTLTFAVLFPIWFFRYARSLWLGFDQFADPRAGEVGTGEESPKGPLN
jgi:uncharacterized protein (DUF983 family)